MKLEDAKRFIGKEVKYQNLTGKLVRVAHPFGISEGGMIIGETDNGIVINIELYKFLDDSGNWSSIT